mgnify:CR=1 FL=1
MTRPIPHLLLALLIALPLSLLAGRVWIDPFDPQTANASVILLHLRLPRACLALAVGAGPIDSGPLGAGHADVLGFVEAGCRHRRDP